MKTVEVKAPPQKVWALLETPEKWKEWAGCWEYYTTKIERASGGLLGLGSHLEVKLRILGIPLRVRTTITEFVPSSYLAYTWKKYEITDTHSYTLEPLNGGTRVTIVDEESGRPLLLFATLLCPLWYLIENWEAQRTASNLRKRTEG